MHGLDFQSEYRNELQISQAIAKAKETASFFSKSLSVDGLLLPANGSSMYIRSEFKYERIECFKLDTPIIAIYSISGSAS